MSIKKNNAYYEENGKIYYYNDAGVREAVPDSAFGDLKSAIDDTYRKNETSGAVELAAAFDSKQDVLSAGTDLKIVGNIIGVNTNGKAVGENSFVEGLNTYAGGLCDHAEGYGTLASGNYSHAGGHSTTANGERSYAGGTYSVANGYASYVYGNYASADGSQSVAFGYQSLARGQNSFTEGSQNSAYGGNSHAEGCNTIASGNYTHTEGYNTIAGTDYMHVGGKFNKTSADALFVIGNGVTNNSRNDAFIVSADGTVSAKKFIEAEPELTITGGTYVDVTEDIQNNKLIIDLGSSLGQMLTELSGVLSAKPVTGHRYILGLETDGSLAWMEINQ